MSLECEKQKHNLTHIPLQPWCTSCVKGKAQVEPHKRTERINSEFPVIQCDTLRAQVHVRTFGCSMSSHGNERPNRYVRNVGSVNAELPWFCSVILRKCQIVTHRKSSHSKFSQTVTSKQWRCRRLSETVAGTGANNVGSNSRTQTIQTICRQRTDEMDCPTCSVAHSSFPR